MQYDNAARKQHRGIVETVFGGLTNAGLLVTRMKKDQKILSYIALVLLRHNVLTLARILASVFELLTKLGATPGPPAHGADFCNSRKFQHWRRRGWGWASQKAKLSGILETSFP